jgi:preprotein translocase subunit YajC
MGPLIFTAVMFVGIYFFLVRPQQTRVRKHAALVSSVSVGDEVVTAGGIVGDVRAVNDRDLLVEVAPGVVLKVVKGAIASKAPDVIDAGEAGE